MGLGEDLEKELLGRTECYNIYGSYFHHLHKLQCWKVEPGYKKHTWPGQVAFSGSRWCFMRAGTMAAVFGGQ